MSCSSAKGADARRQTMKKLAKFLGGALNTATVLRGFLNSSCTPNPHDRIRISRREVSKIPLSDTKFFEETYPKLSVCLPPNTGRDRFGYSEKLLRRELDAAACR
jgi:hypothetical protein